MVRRSRNWLLPALLILFFAGYVVYPVLSLVDQAFFPGGSFFAAKSGGFFDRSTVEAVLNSLLVSILSVLFSGVVGVALSATLTQFSFPFRKIVALFAVVPVALPPLVGVVAFMFVFGETGFVPRLLSAMTGAPASAFSIDGLPAIVAVHVYSFNAFFYLFASAAFEQMDGSLVEAAANLGAGPARVFRTVLLPQLRPALLGAGILTFLSSMASFSAPLLFAGSHRYLTLEIFLTKTNGDIALASRQAILLLAVSLCCFVVLNAVAGSAITLRRSKGASRVVRWSAGRFGRGALIGFTIAVVGIELLPLAIILLASFAREGSWTTQLVPPEYSMGNYTRLLSDASVFQPIVNSVSMSLLGLAGAMLVGGSAAYLMTKGILRRIRRGVDVILSIPYAIPGTVLAIGLILAFNRPTPFSGMAVLVGTFWILPLAYILRTYPLMMRSVSSSLDQIDDGILEAASSLGASSSRRFATIIFPLALPGLIAGSMLTLITLIGEFVASILLYTYANRPIAVEILAQIRSYSFGQASAYCIVVLLVILGVVGVADLLRRRN